MSNLDLTNNQKWSEEIKKHVMLYPNERIVAFLASKFKDLKNNSNKNALDIGFGSGRHLKLLLDYNFNVYGTDYSDECLKKAREILGEDKNLKELLNKNLNDLKYENFFDVIVCFGVIFLREKEQIIKDLSKIKNMLKEKGKMFINFRAKEDWLYGLGKAIDENTFILDERVNEYNGMTYAFFNLDEIKDILENLGFNILNVERMEHWKNNCKCRNVWYSLQVEKN